MTIAFDSFGSTTLDALMQSSLDARAHVESGYLFIGGDFATINAGISSIDKCRSDGVDLFAFTGAPRPSSQVIRFALYAGSLIVVGDSADCVVRYNGTDWALVGASAGVQSRTRAAITYGSNLYIAGDKSFICDGVDMVGIAKWNGSAWSAVGSGITGPYSTDTIFDLFEYGGNLWAGGRFDTIGGVTSESVGQWNGSSWASTGVGLDNGGSQSSLLRFASFGSDLVIAGDFTSIDGVTAKNIASWNGSNWAAFGTGLNAGVYAACEWNGTLYAGGAFTGRLAYWTGSAWTTFGSANNTIYDLEVFNNKLIIGGAFTSIGGASINRIAVYDGSTFASVGGGTSGYVLAVQHLAGAPA
jgi:hypothetical protein